MFLIFKCFKTTILKILNNKPNFLKGLNKYKYCLKAFNALKSFAFYGGTTQQQHVKCLKQINCLSNTTSKSKL